MFKKLFGLVAMLSALAGAACTTLTIPTDYLTIPGLSRANLTLNFTNIQTAHNDCKDSLNLALTRITGWGATLWMKSLQNAIIQVDADNNGTNRFYVTNGISDTLFRVAEDSTAKFFGPLVSAGKIVGSDTIRSVLPLVSQSNIFATGSNLGYWINTPGTFTYGMYQSSTSLAFRSGSTTPWLTVDASGLPTFANASAFTGPVTGNSTGSGTSSAFLASAAAPAFSWYATGGALNTKLWDAQAGATTLSFRTRTDANAAGADWMVVTRSGTTVSGVSFPGTITVDSIISTKFYQEGTWTATITGCTTSPTWTSSWTRVGKQVTIVIPQITATSNSTSLTYTGWPSGLAPAHTFFFHVPYSQDNGVRIYTVEGQVSGTTLTFYRQGGLNWTSSGTKGIDSDFPLTFNLQ